MIEAMVGLPRAYQQPSRAGRRFDIRLSRIDAMDLLVRHVALGQSFRSLALTNEADCSYVRRAVRRLAPQVGVPLSPK